MEYTLKEAQENPKNTVIEKRGHVITFTVAEIEADLKYNRKTIAEFEGQLKLEKAKVENIEKNHPFVLEMSEQDMFTVHMYMEAKSMIKGIEPKLKEFNETNQGLEEELIEVNKQTGIMDAIQAVEEAPLVTTKVILDEASK